MVDQVLYTGINNNQTKTKTFSIPQIDEIKVKIYIGGPDGVYFSEIKITFNDIEYTFTNVDNTINSNEVGVDNTVGWFDSYAGPATPGYNGPKYRYYTMIYGEPQPEPEPDSHYEIQCLLQDSQNTVQMNNPYTFNSEPYASNKKIGVYLGRYTLSGITGDHPFGFVINNTDILEVVSGTEYGTKIVDGIDIMHYTGSIIFDIKSSFSEISYNCFNHGYMGGENLSLIHI